MDLSVPGLDGWGSEAPDAPALADALFALSEQAVIEDLARATALREVAAAREALRASVVAWPGRRRADLVAGP